MHKADDSGNFCSQQLQSFSNSLQLWALHPYSSSGFPSSCCRSLTPTLAAGGWGGPSALCLSSLLAFHFHFVSLSGGLLSLPVRGQQHHLYYTGRQRSKQHKSQQKQNTELANFQPHGSSSKSPSKKIVAIIMVCWRQADALLSFVKFYLLISLHLWS